MKDSEADIAIGVLNKLIDQELEAVRAATRDGNTPFGGYAQTRHNAFLYASLYNKYEDKLEKMSGGVWCEYGGVEDAYSGGMTGCE